MSQIAPPASGGSSESLRDRRRAQTLKDIHQAASDLALGQGFPATTVEQIAQSAGVSVRTVFNYYGTKEDAVLGLVTPVVPEEAMRRFQAQASEPELLARTVALLASILLSMNVAGLDPAVRRRLLGQSGELLERLNSRVVEASQVLDAVLQELHHALRLEPIQRHALRSAAVAVVQEAFILVGHAHFPDEDELAHALRVHRAVTSR